SLRHFPSVTIAVLRTGPAACPWRCQSAGMRSIGARNLEWTNASTPVLQAPWITTFGYAPRSSTNASSVLRMISRSALTRSWRVPVTMRATRSATRSPLSRQEPALLVQVVRGEHPQRATLSAPPGDLVLGAVDRDHGVVPGHAEVGGGVFAAGIGSCAAALRAVRHARGQVAVDRVSTRFPK